MDVNRFKKVTGQMSLLEYWKEINPMADYDSKKSNEDKAESNNKDVENKDILDVRTIDKDADISNEITSELVDTDDSSISPEEGKKDASNQKVIKAGERLYHTVSIGANGAPNVNNYTKLDYVDVESWGDYSEAYVVSPNEDDKVYISEVSETTLTASNDIMNAMIFESVDNAKLLAEMMDIECSIIKVNKVISESEVDKCEEDDYNEDKTETKSMFSKDLDLDYNDFDFTNISKTEAMVLMMDTLTEDMKTEINDKIKSGKKVQLNVKFNGGLLSGYITQATSGLLHLIPTANAKKFYKIIDKQVIVPVDLKDISWSDKHTDRVIGKAKNTDGTNRGEKASFFSDEDKDNYKTKKLDIENKSDIKPSRGSKASFDIDMSGEPTSKSSSAKSGRGTKADFGQPASKLELASKMAPKGMSLVEMFKATKDNK
jgi:hypothetical protein